MSETQMQEVLQQARALADRQQQPDDPELLPKVGLKDIPDDFVIPEGRSNRDSNLPMTWFGAGTNGLVYESLILPLPALEPRETDLFRLYCDFVTELGAGDRNYLQIQEWQAGVSGGVAAHGTIEGTVEDVERVLGFLRFSGSGLVRNQEKLAELIHKMFNHVRFDELDRLRELVAQSRAAREASVTGQGHTLASAAAASGLAPAASLAHRWDGLLGLRRIRDLDESFSDTEQLQEFATALESIHRKMLSVPLQFLAVAEGDNREDIESALAKRWNGANPPEGSLPLFQAEPVSGRVHEAWETNTQVNFCARAYPTVALAHQDAPALLVLGKFLHNGYLHRAVREQGGAYGSGATYDSASGVFRFFSYRDPRLAGTLDDFDNSLRWLQENNHDFRQLEEAILGVISAIDRPASPAGDAIRTHMANLAGRTPVQRRELRRSILDVGVEDLRRVASTWLKPEKESTAVVTNSGFLEQESQLDLEKRTL
jgi:hypothetical protein